MMLLCSFFPAGTIWSLLFIHVDFKATFVFIDQVKHLFVHNINGHSIFTYVSLFLWVPKHIYSISMEYTTWLHVT